MSILRTPKCINTDSLAGLADAAWLAILFAGREEKARGGKSWVNVVPVGKDGTSSLMTSSLWAFSWHFVRPGHQSVASFLYLMQRWQVWSNLWERVAGHQTTAATERASRFTTGRALAHNCERRICSCEAFWKSFQPVQHVFEYNAHSGIVNAYQLTRAFPTLFCLGGFVNACTLVCCILF